MDHLHVVIFSTASAVMMFIFTKLMGNKQISQINLFDYIVGITIGSIVAEMATGLEQPITLPALAIVMYAFFAIAISFVSRKSIGARKIFSGRPLLLMDNGVVYRGNLQKAKIDSSDFLMLCRAKGFFNLSQIQTAVLECNGELSILPKSDGRPVTPADMNLSPEQEEVVTTVVMDGKVLKANLKIANHNDNWLHTRLREQNYQSPKDVFLATCDNKGHLSVYPMVKKKIDVDVFE